MELLPSLAQEIDSALASFDGSDEAVRRALSRFRKAFQLAKAALDDGDSRLVMWENELDKYESKLRQGIQAHEATSHRQRKEALLSFKANAAKPDVAAQSQAATDSMRRTRNLLVRELTRVAEASAVLKDDSERLKDVGGEYASYAHTLGASRKILLNMQRRERTDELFMYLGLAFFICVVAFIVQRRLMPFVAPVAWLVERLAWLVYGAVEKVSAADAASLTGSGSAAAAKVDL